MPIFNSLRFRLITSVVTIEVIMLSILVWNNISIIHEANTDRLRDTANNMIQQISSTVGNYMVAVDYATLEGYLEKIFNYKELSYIVIVDRDEKAVISLGTVTPEVRPEIDTHPALVRDGVFDIANVIKVANRPMGRILMGFSLSLMDEAIKKARNRGITIASIEIVLTISVTILIGLGLTRRLGELSRAAAEVEAGNYSISVPTETNDEVGKTAMAFNRMVAEVAKRTQMLLSEEKKTQQLLGENRQLMKKSQEMQEEERRHISRELHDELGQCITAIQADAESIKDLAQKTDNRITIRADAILDVSAHIYNVVHSMMHRLRPSMLDNLGLVEALKDEIDNWSKRNTSISCVFDYEGDFSNLGERISISVYRIVQECLTNVTKHTNASQVNIVLINDQKGVGLTITDNGVGVNLEAYNESGLGLIGMRERVQALNGQFEHSSLEDTGFRISMSIPREG